MIDRRRIDVARARTPLAVPALSLALVVVGVFSASSGACAADPESSDDQADAGVKESGPTMFDAPPIRIIGPAVECAIGSAIEAEPNDSPMTATSFTELSVCGVLETAKDVDYLAFETPSGTKLSVFQAVIDGKVELALTYNGETFGPSQTDKFGAGKYVVKAFTNAGKPASYRIRVQFDPN